MVKKILVCTISIVFIFIISYANLYNTDAVVGWKTQKGKVYYYNTSGKKVKGWNTIGDDTFYMNSKGVVVTKWKKINNKTYYFRPKANSEHRIGSMVTGKQTISAIEYVFDDNGVLKGSFSKTVKPNIVEEQDGYTQTIKLNNKTFKLYKQGQGTWATENYYSCSNNTEKVEQYTYKSCGCGPSSLAIVLSGYKEDITPITVGQKCLKNSIPSSLQSMKKVVNQLGFKCKIHSYSSNYSKTYKEIKNALIANHKVVLYVGKTAPESYWEMFTKSGYHFISILAIDKCNDKAFVGNSAGNCDSDWYDLSTIVKARGNSNSKNKMPGWLEIYK